MKRVHYFLVMSFVALNACEKNNIDASAQYYHADYITRYEQSGLMGSGPGGPGNHN